MLSCFSCGLTLEPSGGGTILYRGAIFLVRMGLGGGVASDAVGE